MAQAIQKWATVILLFVMMGVAMATPPGIANNPSHSRCTIKKYKHCYNLEHVCPKFCPDSCTTECVSCKPICSGGSTPTPSPSPPPPTPTVPYPSPSPPPPTPTVPYPSPSPPTPTPNVPSPPPPTPNVPSPPPATPSIPSPPPPTPTVPSPPPPTPTVPSPPPPTPTVPYPSPSPPPPTVPSPSPPMPTPTVPSPSPPPPTITPTVPSPPPPTTPTTPSPSSPPPLTPAPITPSSPPPPPPTPPTWSPPPSTDESAKTAKCKNKNYPQCYNTEYKCPKDCPGGCEVDCVTCKPVCKCDKPGSVCQDPRFIGGDGITFYFHGKKDQDFCLLSDSNLHINAHFIGKRNAGMKRDFTWVQSIAILFDKHTFFVGALKTPTWDDSFDRLSLSFDGNRISLPESDGAKWRSDSGEVSVARVSGDTNSVEIAVDGKFKITAKVVPITEEESRIHKYGVVAGEDSFAHLDLGFKFFGLSGGVKGVLGQTYRPDYVSRVKIGASMPVMGGDKEFGTTSLMTADCAVSRFNGGNDGGDFEETAELPGLSCGSGMDGRGVVCKR